MRTAIFALLCLAVVAVSAQPKGGAPLQARLGAARARVSPNQACTALNAGATVKGSCWTAATCAKHKGKGLPSTTAQAPGNKCPAGQSCCVTGLPAAAAATPAAATAPAAAKPPAPAASADPCAARNGKPSRYVCMTCVNTRDKHQLRCKYDVKSGVCFGSHYRYGAEADTYQRLLRSKNVNAPGDCERL